MTGRPWPALMMVGSLVMAVTGCQRSYPQPSAEAVLNFLQNARLHGRLRVCWPAGQEYVERVMRADAALREALRQWAPIQTVDDLWARDDPRWRSERQVATGSPGAEPAPTAVAAALDALSAAVAQLPQGLPLTGTDSPAAFVDRVWQALAIDGQPLRDYVAELEALGRLQIRLRTRIVECAAHFDTNAAGLSYQDDNCRSQVDALYDELAAALRAREQRILEYAAGRMAAVYARINQVDKQKQRDEYLLLDNTREYFDNLFRDGWLKRLDDRIRAAHQKLAAHRSGKLTLLASEAAFLERELERLKHRYAALSQQVEATLKAPGDR